MIREFLFHVWDSMKHEITKTLTVPSLGDREVYLQWPPGHVGISVRGGRQISYCNTHIRHHDSREAFFIRHQECSSHSGAHTLQTHMIGRKCKVFALISNSPIPAVLTEPND